MADPDSNLIQLTTEITANYVTNNAVVPTELPALIRSVHEALKGVESGRLVKQPEGRPAPFVPIRKSVTPDYIISLFDGRRFKSMRRYLSTKHGMTPQDYRAYWGLPADYPIVAPNYTASRSALAKGSGLGQGGGKPAARAAPPPAPEPERAPPKGARKPKAAAAE